MRGGGGRDGGQDLHVDLLHHGQLPGGICTHSVSLTSQLFSLRVKSPAPRVTCYFVGLTMSPVRLKRYEGFEQGLNTIPAPATKGIPYK